MSTFTLADSLDFDLPEGLDLVSELPKPIISQTVTTNITKVSICLMTTSEQV